MVFLLWNRILAKAGTILEEEWSSMNYEEARAYLDDAARYGSVLGLDTMKELLARLGNPQDDLKFIHIGGTNGKGSVLSYLSAVLKEAGYRVGRYISPTLFSYRERIQVNEIYIKKDALARLTTQIQSCADEMVRDGAPHPTAFEIETALCFLYFREEKCDLVVLEVGMGGATDATNVIKTTVLESARINQHGSYGISWRHSGRDRRVQSRYHQARYDCGQHETAAGSHGSDPAGLSKAEGGSAYRRCGKCNGHRIWCEEQYFSYGGYDSLEIHLAGSYQIANAVLAVEAVKALIDLGYAISEEALRVVCKGREGQIYGSSKRAIFY